VSISVAFSTERDRAGMPQMGSLKTNIRCLVDFHDDQNIPYSALSKMFELANVVTRDKVKDMKVEFWKDESHQDALCSYSFNGWIRRFETTNPIELTALDKETEAQFRSLTPDLNHVLVLDLEPAMNQQNFKEIKMSN